MNSKIAEKKAGTPGAISPDPMGLLMQRNTRADSCLDWLLFLRGGIDHGAGFVKVCTGASCEET